MTIDWTFNWVWPPLFVTIDGVTVVGCSNFYGNTIYCSSLLSIIAILFVYLTVVGVTWDNCPVTFQRVQVLPCSSLIATGMRHIHTHTHTPLPFGTKRIFILYTCLSIAPITNSQIPIIQPFLTQTVRFNKPTMN